jgi:hypothetical protein
MSSGSRILSTEQVRAAARQLISAEPMLHTAAPGQLLQHLGWTECENPGYRNFVIADAGLNVARCLALLHLSDADRTVTNLSVGVCDNLGPRAPGRAALGRDAFAFAARALLDTYGRPYESEAGDRASLWWRLGDASLFLHLGSSTTRLAMHRTSDYDRLVEISKYEESDE